MVPQAKELERIRAGVAALPRGQTEAAYSLGLRPGPTLRLIVVPQAMRVIIPPMTNQFLNLTKNSSLAVAIGYPDVVSIANTAINQTGRAVECIAIIMLVYLREAIEKRGGLENIKSLDELNAGGPSRAGVRDHSRDDRIGSRRQAARPARRDYAARHPIRVRRGGLGGEGTGECFRRRRAGAGGSWSSTRLRPAQGAGG